MSLKAAPVASRSFDLVCSSAVLLSSFLLFAVELIIGKFLLPWFGGVPATWITCLLFFQVTLLVGYAYAHRLSSARPRVQAVLHSAVIAISLLLLVCDGDPLAHADYARCCLEAAGDDTLRGKCFGC